ncbi:Retrovirus-related Pol polyprotein from transposon [Halotydeus destructor]|nr:Retrovirus-related Pol polyprotein from transposon [Halotydeus destructor]
MELLEGTLLEEQQKDSFCASIKIDLLRNQAKANGSKGSEYIILGTDSATRYVIGRAVKKADAISAAKFVLEDIIEKYGTPRVLASDNATHFVNNLIGELLRLLNIKHRRTTPYRPQSNAILERKNRSLGEILTKLVHKTQRTWDIHLQSAITAYNSAKHEALGYSPYFLLFVMEYPTTCDRALNTPVNDSHVLRQQRLMAEFRDEARKRVEAAQIRSKKQYDIHHRNVAYETGQLVLKRLEVQDPVSGKTLSHRYEGPYRIAGKIGDLTYFIEKISDRGSKRKAHVAQLKPYFEREVDEFDLFKESAVWPKMGHSDLTGSEIINVTPRIEVAVESAPLLENDQLDEQVTETPENNENLTNAQPPCDTTSMPSNEIAPPADAENFTLEEPVSEETRRSARSRLPTRRLQLDPRAK